MTLDSATKRLITLALDEDLGPGDVTSLLIGEQAQGSAQILAKSELVLAGAEAFSEVFRQLDPTVRVEFDVRDGTEVAAHTVLGTTRGNARSLLAGERTALNLLQRLSGIATLAKRASRALAGSRAVVVDTRKTTPGMRALEKQAVRAGGAKNHRVGLFDGVLIKDNHVAAAGGVAAAIALARGVAHHLLRIECEVTTLDEVHEALRAGADVILLDNMDLPTLKTAVAQIAGRALIEVSGGVRIEDLAALATLDVDFISMGALTHSAPASDISLEWIR